MNYFDACYLLKKQETYVKILVKPWNSYTSRYDVDGGNIIEKRRFNCVFFLKLHIL